MKYKNFFTNIIDRFKPEIKEVTNPGETPNTKDTSGFPYSRRSEPPIDTKSILNTLRSNTGYIDYSFIQMYIPVIRKLSWIHADLGLAIHDIVQLTNTGHIIKFDKSVSSEEQSKMNLYLTNLSKTWGDGVAGIDGMVNRMIAQIWISGALSGEWVISKDFRYMENNVLVNPEDIVFKYNNSTGRYDPYQKSKKPFKAPLESLNKLNKNTYKYFALNGDTEIPYGIPPMLTALEAIATQKDMTTNIKFIIKQLGLMGFFEVLLDKPPQQEGENTDAYKARLIRLLSESKENLADGMSNGIVAGYKDDHEFNFNSTTKNVSGLDSVFNINEAKVANGLKTPPSFLSMAQAKGTETAISIIFTKMLSQLKNVQSLVASYLGYGYMLSLQLGGFKFDHLTVEFKTSTITDDLKVQQSKEIKQRVLHNLRIDGIIGQDTYAEEMGYDSPYSDEPEVSYEDQAGVSEPVQDAADSQTREKSKDKSDRKGRQKKKAQPDRKDQKTE